MAVNLHVVEEHPEEYSAAVYDGGLKSKDATIFLYDDDGGYELAQVQSLEDAEWVCRAINFYLKSLETVKEIQSSDQHGWDDEEETDGLTP